MVSENFFLPTHTCRPPPPPRPVPMLAAGHQGAPRRLLRPPEPSGSGRTSHRAPPLRASPAPRTRRATTSCVRAGRTVPPRARSPGQRRPSWLENKEPPYEISHNPGLYHLHHSALVRRGLRARGEGMAMGMEGGDYGAFMEKFELLPPQSQQPEELPLHGLTFAIKDIFDISGRVTGFGNPDWARTHAPAAATSPVVLATLAAGATSVGKTVMDEMAYSINGENAHYGTPTNPCAPDRVPGGSSSGSAVAVAAKLVDFALGTDTGGSVRVPAAYCGIFGLRPSHGVVSTENVIPMSQMFDTVGWFARDLSTFSCVSDVLLPLPADNTIKQPTQFTIPKDCFEILGSLKDQTYQILNASVAKRFGSDAVDNTNLGEFVSNNVPTIGKFISDFSKSEAPSVPALSVISYVMRCLQRSEFKANHAEWVNTVKPNLGPGIRERVQEAIASQDGPMEDFYALRTEFKSALAALVKDDGILAIPTVPGSPPKLHTEAAALENFRARAFSLLSIAGLSGFCQLSIPLGVRDGIPVSVSLVARHGADRFLLSVAQELYEALREETKKAWSSIDSSL